MAKKLPPQNRANFTPTPKQIRAACKLIRDSWDVATERSRRTGSAEKKPLEFAEVPSATLFGAPDRGG